MSSWHGYEQHPDAHPERPWWRLAYPERMPGAPMPRGFGGPTHRRTDGREGHVDYLGEIDAAHPLPPPEPKCGQVWVWPKGKQEHLVTDITLRASGRTRVQLGVDGPECWLPDVPAHEMGTPWPPPGAVLVAGPGAPWAPEVPRG